MLKAINLAETRDYVSRQEKDTNNPTIFKLGVLDVFIRAQLDDKIASFEIDTRAPENSPAVAVVKNASNMILVFRLGVKSIENMIDPSTGKALQFNLVNFVIGGKNYMALPERVVSLFSMDVIREVSDAILNANILDEESEKN